MTVVTGIGCLDMGQVLARCGDAIVAGTACTDHLRMVYSIGGRPEHHIVAAFTGIRRTDM